MSQFRKYTLAFLEVRKPFLQIAFALEPSDREWLRRSGSQGRVAARAAPIVSSLICELHAVTPSTNSWVAGSSGGCRLPPIVDALLAQRAADVLKIANDGSRVSRPRSRCPERSTPIRRETTARDGADYDDPGSRSRRFRLHADRRCTFVLPPRFRALALRFVGGSAGQSLAVTEVTPRQNAPAQGWSTVLAMSPIDWRTVLNIFLIVPTLPETLPCSCGRHLFGATDDWSCADLRSRCLVAGPYPRLSVVRLPNCYVRHDQSTSPRLTTS